MDASRSRDPYLPPATSRGDLPPGPVVRCGPRVLAWSLVLGAAYGLVTGAGSHIQLAWGLRQFGGVQYVPRVIGLSAARGWGPWGAALVAALTAVVVVHRIGRQSAEAVSDRHLPAFVGVAVLLLYPVVAAAACVGALVAWRAAGDGTVDAFVTALTDGLRPMDLAWGAASSALYALVVALGMGLAAASLRSRRWRLVPKVLVVWAALQGVAYAVGYLGRSFA